MKLLSRDISPSPDREDMTRVSVRIHQEAQDRELNAWFDVPAQYEPEISLTGNPWLMLMMPLAMQNGEEISLPYPVEPHFLENIRGIMRFLSSQFPELRPAEVSAPEWSAAAPPGRRKGMYFSGGVDSTFTFMRHDTAVSGCGSGIVDDLIFVAGFDIPVGKAHEIERACDKLERVSAAHAKRFVPIFTNLREIDTFYSTNWLLTYGYALATVGHLLERRYGELIISAAHTLVERPVTGSHPVTDPLLSSRHLRFVHDGATFDRVEKTQRIAESGGFLDTLRVCWESKRHDNCSRCRKCLLTMVTLDLAGYRGRASCFDWSDYSVERLASIFVDGDVQAIFFREVLADARRRGRADVAAVVEGILARSDRVRAIIRGLRRTPLLWRFEFEIGRFLLRRAFGTGDSQIRG